MELPKDRDLIPKSVAVADARELADLDTRVDAVIFNDDLRGWTVSAFNFGETDEAANAAVAANLLRFFETFDRSCFASIERGEPRTLFSEHQTTLENSIHRFGEDLRCEDARQSATERIVPTLKAANFTQLQMGAVSDLAEEFEVRRWMHFDANEIAGVRRDGTAVVFKWADIPRLSARGLTGSALEDHLRKFNPAAKRARTGFWKNSEDDDDDNGSGGSGPHFLN